MELKHKCSKEQHVRKNLAKFKRRSKDKHIEFDLDFDYLMGIANNVCPAFDIELAWGKRTNGVALPNSPSLDRINPEIGYVKGNVQWVSFLANRMKNSADKEQLVKFAKWILSGDHSKPKNTNP